MDANISVRPLSMRGAFAVAEAGVASAASELVTLAGGLFSKIVCTCVYVCACVPVCARARVSVCMSVRVCTQTLLLPSQCSFLAELLSRIHFLEGFSWLYAGPERKRVSLHPGLWGPCSAGGCGVL